MKKKVDEYQTVRIWKKTHRLLKSMAATQGDSLIVFLNRLAENELQRMKEENSVSATVNRSRPTTY